MLMHNAFLLASSQGREPIKITLMFVIMKKSRLFPMLGLDGKNYDDLAKLVV